MSEEGPKEIAKLSLEQLIFPDNFAQWWFRRFS